MQLADYSLEFIFLASVAFLVASSEVGRRYCRLEHRQGREDVSTVEASILGLLALMIGFTFALSLSRFEARREAVLREANAIGTTALRARMLPAPHNTQCLTLLKEYVGLRLDVTRHHPQPTEYKAAIDRSNAIHEALWVQAMAVAGKDPGLVPTGIFIQSLNDMIDSQGTRLAAVASQVPNVVLCALYGFAVIGALSMGYAAALNKQSSRVPIYTMAALVAVVLVLIQDLDRPRAGFIMVSQQPMEDVAAAISAFPE